MDSFLQNSWQVEVVESQAHLQGLDLVLHQLGVIDFVHISVLKLKVCKSSSLWYYM
jgi:hypothetical protein